MTHSSTSPPELSDEQVGEWLIDDGYPWDPSEQAVITITTNRLKNVACQAFQAGADQELEACCEVLDNLNDGFWSEKLRAARRPKPPSLKEQALEILAGVAVYELHGGATTDNRLSAEDMSIIRAHWSNSMTEQHPSSITLNTPTDEIIRIDKEGFHYRGQFIADAGEAHRLMVEFLKQNTSPKLQQETDRD